MRANVSDTGAGYWMELAYIRAASGREFTTAVAHVQPAYDQPKTAAGRRDLGSA
ncbi:hypothetical protein [Streptomyces katrae]|uniref:hypothetical protein n=1 Tax=Streptomyces katrae TaxID=68223 RepID=UPI001396B1EF|nr:hypothetical protein [Streptomyces katrae]